MLQSSCSAAVAIVPNDQRIYAIGDIHGRSDLLDRLLDTISVDQKNGPPVQKMVFLGDYVDRGPDSKGVIERLTRLAALPGTHFLRGNHDQILLDFLKDPMIFETWCEFGGMQTLLSYGVSSPKLDRSRGFFHARDQLATQLPKPHLDFLGRLQVSVQIGDYFFAHAGVKPGTPLNEQTESDLLWIRDEFLNSTEDFGKVIVHGHTPEITPVNRGNRIGVDTGAFLSGKLTAAVLEGRQCRFLQT